MLCSFIQHKTFLHPCLPVQKAPGETPNSGIGRELLHASPAVLLAGGCLFLDTAAAQASSACHQAAVCISRAGNESCVKLADNPCCMYAAMDRYTAIKYNILIKTCLILSGSPLTLLALSHGWCLLTFQSSTVDCRNKNSFFSRLCADTEAVGCTLSCVHSGLHTHL